MRLVDLEHDCWKAKSYYDGILIPTLGAIVLIIDPAITRPENAPVQQEEPANDAKSPVQPAAGALTANASVAVPNSLDMMQSAIQKADNVVAGRDGCW